VGPIGSPFGKETFQVGQLLWYLFLYAAKNTLDAARKANNDANKRINDATKAHNAFAWETTKLVTYLLQPQDYTGGPFVMPGRYLESAQEVRYPWRSVDKRRR
jgi:hypothetical protein